MSGGAEVPREEVFRCDAMDGVIGQIYEIKPPRGGAREVILCPAHVDTAPLKQVLGWSRPATVVPTKRQRPVVGGSPEYIRARIVED